MKAIHPIGCDFYDVDHTIVDCSTSLQSLVTGIGLKILPLSILYSIPKLYLQYNFGSMDISIASKCIHDLKGIPKEEVLKIGELNYQTKVRPRIFRQAAEGIARRMSSGRLAVLLTSSFRHVVQPLATELRIEHVLANVLLYDNDRTSGYIREPFLFGEEKKIQARTFMDAHGISPTNCSFYTDSFNDLSLLEIVGEPVAVNPDYRLRRIARERNWRIESFSGY